MIALSSSTRSARAAVLDALVVAGALDEDAAHGERRGGEEVAAPIPAPVLVDRRTTRRYASWTSAVGCSVWFGWRSRARRALASFRSSS